MPERTAVPGPSATIMTGTWPTLATVVSEVESAILGFPCREEDTVLVVSLVGPASRSTLERTVLVK